MDPQVYLNGKLIELGQACIPVSSTTLLHGVGLFETLRCYNGTAMRLDRHMARLQTSAARLKVAVDPAVQQIPDAVRLVLDANGLANARLRITLMPPGPHQSVAEPTLLVTAEYTTGYPPETYERGWTACLCTDHRQSVHDPLAGHKTTSYFARLLVLRDAQNRGCQEALWFTPRNLLAEGCISNVFVIKNGTLITPPLDTPVLPGVTREAVLQLAAAAQIPAEERDCTVDELLDADEILLTNSVMEIMPVTRIEKKPIAGEKPGPVTRQLAEAYRDLVSAECGRE
ncbi:MAG: hypothetical protein GXY55_14035 [Phycisphaerae bacterium]|nr:hypothetical protein [Phycisphaerae bacterium]